MSSISLEASLRTCKVDTGWANKVESDRFLNPSLMVCPTWNGRDLTGRQVCPDSFYTKRAGCNSATDRVVVENNVSRPQYMEYINLNAAGIGGQIYGMGHRGVQIQQNEENAAHQHTGQFGTVTGNGLAVQSGCQANSGSVNNGQFITNHRAAMAQEHQHNRENQRLNNGYYAQQNLGCGGN